MFLRSLALGVAAGLRAMAPLTVLGFSPMHRCRGRSAAGRAALLAASLGETVVDKLPRTPSRLKLGPLGVRLATGAIAGGMLFRRSRRMRRLTALGALAGAAGALAGAFGGYHGRRALALRARVPDLVLGAVEDAVAVTFASWAAH
jgi:uncharacterized membrane protein